MGSLWVAEHGPSKRPVAVKLVSSRHSRDKATLARFHREADAVSKISSPNVVRIFEHGTTDEGVPYIVMELLEGETLGDRLARVGRLSLVDHAAVLRQVASALDLAHARGIVHRDIKPDNIFLVGDDDFPLVKVLDFGMAKEVGLPKATENSIITATGVAVGTPEYMSPEQVLGSKDVDHRSDLWALGVVTYRALAGVMPFVGETPHALFFNVCKGAYTPLSELGLPAELDPWFKHVLCPSKEGRVSSASELVAEYDRAIEAALGRSSKPSGGSFDEEAATQLFNVGRLRGLAIPTSPPAMASAPPPAEGSDHSQVDSASVPPRADRVASDPELFPPEVGAGETWQLEPESAEAGSLELSFDSLEQTNELLKRASLAETRPLDDARIAVGEADTERQRSTREETPPRYAEPDTVRADRTATPSVTAAGDAAPATPEGSVDERGTASAPEAEAGVPLDAVAAAAPREPVAARAPTEESTSGTRSALSATAAPAASRGGRGWLALSAAVVVAGAVGSVLLLRPGGAGQPRAGASSAAAVPASAKAAQGAALAPDKAAGNVEAAIPVVGSGPAEQPPVGAGPAARPVAAASAAAPLGAVSAPLSLPSAVPVATAPAVAPTAAMPPPSANGVWPGAAASSTPPVAPRPSGAMPGIRTAPTSKGWTPDGI